MEVIKTGTIITLEGEFEGFRLKLSSGKMIMGIIYEDVPLYSVADFLNVIGAGSGGSTYETIRNNAWNKHKFESKKLGLFVSIDVLVRYSSRLRKNLDNEFFIDLIELIQEKLFEEDE